MKKQVISEKDKESMPDTYIRNPITNKYVKRTSVTGKRIVEAEVNGKEYRKTDAMMVLVDFLLENDLIEKEVLISAISDSCKKDKSYKKVLSKEVLIWAGVSNKDKKKTISAKNGYMRYCEEIHDKVHSEVMDMITNGSIKENEKFTTMSSIKGRMWRELSDTKKDEYNKQFKEEKERLLKEAGIEVSPKNDTKRTTGFILFKEDNKDRICNENDLDINDKDDRKKLTGLISDEWKSHKESKDEVFNKYSELAKSKNSKNSVRKSEPESKLRSAKIKKKVSDSEKDSDSDSESEIELELVESEVEKEDSDSDNDEY